MANIFLFAEGLLGLYLLTFLYRQLVLTLITACGRSGRVQIVKEWVYWYSNVDGRLHLIWMLQLLLLELIERLWHP